MSKKGKAIRVGAKTLAGVMVPVKVLSNPFRAQPQSARYYYNAGVRHLTYMGIEVPTHIDVEAGEWVDTVWTDRETEAVHEHAMDLCEILRVK